MNRTQSGFTLLELMMTMAILVLIISMAMPSMTGFVQRNRLSAEVRGIVGAVALARSEAISRRTLVAVMPRILSTPAVATDWNTGWQVIEIGSDAKPIDANVFFRQSDPFPTGYSLVFDDPAAMSPGEVLAFNARGLVVRPGKKVIITLDDGNDNISEIHMPLSGSAYVRSPT
jgi:prepilin-type N-terminal cleavage/methylation domain-containing protein